MTLVHLSNKPKGTTTYTITSPVAVKVTVYSHKGDGQGSGNEKVEGETVSLAANTPGQITVVPPESGFNGSYSFSFTFDGDISQEQFNTIVDSMRATSN